MPSLALLAAAGDLDDDGKADVVTACSRLDYPDGLLAVLRNTGCEERRLAIGGGALGCVHPGEASSSPRVARVTDDGGNTVTCAAGTVTASLVAGTGTPGAVLGGDTNVSLVGGVATFSDLSIDLAGAGYTLAFTHAAGATRVAGIDVASNPAAPVASNSGAFCPGETISLYATSVPGASYLWTGPDGFLSTLQSPIIPSAPASADGTYSVIAIVGGCSSSPATTEVPLSAPPAGPVIQGEDTVCKLWRLQLVTDGSAAQYQWYHDGVAIPYATGATYSVPSASDADAGLYTVTAATASGCVSLTSDPVSVSIIEGCSITPMGLAVDPTPGAQSNGNGILEPLELAVVVPTWRNAEPSQLTLIGTASNLTGPQPAAYVLADDFADYGDFTRSRPMTACRPPATATSSPSARPIPVPLCIGTSAWTRPRPRAIPRRHGRCTWDPVSRTSLPRAPFIRTSRASFTRALRRDAARVSIAPRTS